MRHGEWGRAAAVIMLVPLLLVLGARPAFAYLGPGSGLVAIGMFLAVVAAIAAAIAGFLWYPTKRLFRAIRGRPDRQDSGAGRR